MKRSALFAAVALGASGCGGSYLRLDSRLVDAARPTEHDVTATPEYHAMVRSLRRVAVRAPEGCADDSAGRATGVGKTESVVVKTECGVEMAELERELAHVGFTVTSWKVLKNLVESGSRDVNTPVAAAKQLGAEVLFQVNSLERQQISRSDARWERRLWESDRYGSQRRAALVDESTYDAIKRLAREDESKLQGTARLGATLDVNAVSVETGQTIWFFRGSKTEDAAVDATATVLAHYDDGSWQSVAPRKAPHSKRELRSGDVEAVSKTARSRDDENAMYFRLIRSVVRDFSALFVSGADDGPRAKPTRQAGHE